MKNNNLETGKMFLLIGGIISFVAGFFMILGFIAVMGFSYFAISYRYRPVFAIFPLIILLILLLVDIFGGFALIKLNKLGNDQLLENSNKILMWGIILVFTNFFGGISAIIGYILITRPEEIEQIEQKESVKLDELEKIFELKENGLITEEEFKELKRKIFENN